MWKSTVFILGVQSWFLGHETRETPEKAFQAAAETAWQKAGRPLETLPRVTYRPIDGTVFIEDFPVGCVWKAAITVAGASFGG